MGIIHGDGCIVFVCPPPAPPVGRLSLGIKLSCKIHLLPLPPLWAGGGGLIFVELFT